MSDLRGLGTRIRGTKDRVPSVFPSRPNAATRRRTPAVPWEPMGAETPVANVKREGPRERLLLVLVAAAVLAALDLTVKMTLPTPEWAFHQRSPAWAILSALLLVGACALALVPSRAVALAAGVTAGGVLGNLASALWDGNRVPNPLVFGDEMNFVAFIRVPNPLVFGDEMNFVAFNLADVVFSVGNLVLMATLITVTIRNRDRLIPPRRLARALYQRTRS